jgi:hypothetical protein
MQPTRMLVALATRTNASVRATNAFAPMGARALFTRSMQVLSAFRMQTRANIPVGNTITTLPLINFTYVKYYSLLDLQTTRVMASGRNSETKDQVKQGQLSYHSIDHSPTELALLAKKPPDEVAAYADFEIFEHDELIDDDL